VLYIAILVNHFGKDILSNQPLRIKGKSGWYKQSLGYPQVELLKHSDSIIFCPRARPKK
jgi:hypothetical protein